MVSKKVQKKLMAGELTGAKAKEGLKWIIAILIVVVYLMFQVVKNATAEPQRIKDVQVEKGQAVELTPTNTKDPKKKKQQKKRKKQTQSAYRECKIQAIRGYFKGNGAPLWTEAKVFIEVSEKYGLDWRLLPAIAMIESTGGKYNFRTYNPFGWGKTNFTSYRQAIDTVGRGIKKGYYDKGCRSVACISKKYCPPTQKVWAHKVAFVESILQKRYEQCKDLTQVK